MALSWAWQRRATYQCNVAAMKRRWRGGGRRISMARESRISGSGMVYRHA